MLKPIIGHSKDVNTFSTYGHELDGAMKIVANEISDIF